jgi:hypothetical protein
MSLWATTSNVKVSIGSGGFFPTNVQVAPKYHFSITNLASHTELIQHLRLTLSHSIATQHIGLSLLTIILLTIPIVNERRQ